MLTIADVDLGHRRPSTIPLEIVEKVLMVIEDVDKVPRPSILPPISQVTMVYCCIYFLLLIFSLKLFTTMKELTVVVMMQDMKLGINIPVTITFTITDKVLMVMGEVDMGLKSSPFPPIIQVSLVDSYVLLFMIMIEVEIGLRPATFIHITTVGYTL